MFTAVRSTAKYCSDDCRWNAHRERRAAEPAADPWDKWVNPTEAGKAERDRAWQEWYDSQPDDESQYQRDCEAREAYQRERLG
jgi:hypothetical protein